MCNPRYPCPAPSGQGRNGRHFRRRQRLRIRQLRCGRSLAKMTAFMAVLFIVTSLSYNYVSSSHKAQESTILDVRLEDTQNLPLPLPRFPQLLLKSPLRLPLPTSPPTKHHPKCAFEAMKQFMASFFIRARPQNLPPFLLDLAKKQRPRYCPTTVFLRPFIMLRNILWMHGKAPLPSSRRFLNPPPRSSLSSKQKRPGKRS